MFNRKEEMAFKVKCCQRTKIKKTGSTNVSIGIIEESHERPVVVRTPTSTSGGRLLPGFDCSAP